MIRNTGDFIRVLKIWAGGLTLLGAGVIGFIAFQTAGRRKKYHRDFDPEDLIEFTGNITGIAASGSKKHADKGVILTVASGEEEFEVHLGPCWYIIRQFKRFKRGERITLTGSVVNYKGQDIVVAQTLERGSTTYRLRDKHGSPFWQSRVS